MKVIKRPAPPAQQYQLTCAGCGITVECALSELHEEHDREGIAYVLDCPECKHGTWFAEGALSRRRARA